MVNATGPLGAASLNAWSPLGRVNSGQCSLELVCLEKGGGGAGE